MPVVQLVGLEVEEKRTTSATVAHVLLPHAISSMRIVLVLINAVQGVSNRIGVVALVAVVNWQPPVNLVKTDPLGMIQKERANQQN